MAYCLPASCMVRHQAFGLDKEHWQKAPKDHAGEAKRTTGERE